MSVEILVKRILEKITLLVWVYGKEKVFDKYWFDNGPNHYTVRDYINSLSPQSIFEFGMFVGRNLKDIDVNRIGGCNINARAIQYANQRLKGNFITIRKAGDLCKIDTEYELIICICVFYAVN